MASRTLLLSQSIFLALIFTLSEAGGSIFVEAHPQEEEQVVRSDGPDTSSLKIELDQLKSRIQTLEPQIDDKTRELKEKDAMITEKEKIIQEKTESILSLQNERASIQKKGKVDAQELVGKAHAHAAELEKQVEQLKKEIEAKNKAREALEAQTKEAEKKVSDWNFKLDDLHKIVDEQKSKIHKTERALQVAEEEMMKAKFEAASRTKDLMQVHGAWLPPWLAAHVTHFHSYVETHWKEHGKPAVDLVRQKAMEKKAKAQKWAEPHMETIKSKWIPAAKEKWLMISTYVEPHIKLLTEKTIEVYETSMSAVTPHVIGAREFIDPYFQEVKKCSRPYIDQVAIATKPHVDKVRGVLKPYTKEVVHAYGKFLEYASMYHHQVQDIVHETLKKHELTRPLATKELVWFTASAFLAFPIIILFRVCSASFCKKEMRPNRISKSSHARRKAK